MMIKKIFLWLLVNAILPMAIPAFLLALVEWFITEEFPIRNIFIELLNSGFYIFSAATLIFSLYEEYDVCKKCIGLLMQSWLVVLIFVTLGMFYQIQNKDTSYLENHNLQFGITWFMTAISAGIVKYKIIKYKSKVRI